MPSSGEQSSFLAVYAPLTTRRVSASAAAGPTARHLRRAAIHHALLSYVFGTVVVALTITVVAGLLGR